MKRVEMLQTRDGLLHASEEAAKKHAEARYGEALSTLVRNMRGLTETTRYVEMHRRIESELDQWLDAFVTLKEMKKDCDIPPPREDDDDDQP